MQRQNNATLIIWSLDFIIAETFLKNDFGGKKIPKRLFWQKSIWKTIVKNDYGDKDFETMSHLDLWIL